MAKPRAKSLQSIRFHQNAKIHKENTGELMYQKMQGMHVHDEQREQTVKIS
jgi:hypothetical protein